MHAILEAAGLGAAYGKRELKPSTSDTPMFSRRLGYVIAFVNVLVELRQGTHPKTSRTQCGSGDEATLDCKAAIVSASEIALMRG
jgi:hypothetical protein